jgi:hypothetical protein
LLAFLLLLIEISLPFKGVRTSITLLGLKCFCFLSYSFSLSVYLFIQVIPCCPCIYRCLDYNCFQNTHLLQYLKNETTFWTN